MFSIITMTTWSGRGTPAAAAVDLVVAAELVAVVSAAADETVPLRAVTARTSEATRPPGHQATSALTRYPHLNVSSASSSEVISG
ncbi:hypothetical protein [Streptomyces sp. NPDC000994]